MNQAVSTHRARILIVDDELTNRKLLEIRLRSEGFDILTAESAEQALALLAHEPLDLILLDVLMPGMDGYQAVEQIKANPSTKNIPVIMVSALDNRVSRMKGLKAGAEDFLSKPIDPVELRLRVRNLLRLKAYSDHHDKYNQLLEAEVSSGRADLVASERLYRSTFDAAPVGIVHMSLDGTWLQVNQRVCEFLGYTREQLLSADVQRLLAADAAKEHAEALLAMARGVSERFVVDEQRFQRADGGFVWGRVNVSSHHDGDGSFQHFIAVIEDITERRTLETQVRQTNKMDAIGRLASGVAHDFNNLLAVILGCAEFMNDEAGQAGPHSSDIREIIRSANQAAELTKQLLAFSRQQLLQPKPTDVNALIRQMVRMLNRLIGARVEVNLILQDELSLAQADGGQLEQVVMNLVVNARDAMPAGGIVTIETSDVVLAEEVIHHEAVVPGPYVMISVSDNGKGMTQDTLRRLFEPFFTTKEIGHGTGLGLSTTYGIVKQSKGYIGVRSELGAGTTFKVYLPRSAQSLTASLAPAPHVARGGSETVLLVEDEPGVRRLSARILNRAGYTVVEAYDGNDAYAQFAQRAHAIDLVVTDINMPGCDGPQLVRRLRAHTPELPVLYMSGYAERSTAHEAGIDQGAAFIQKPFSTADFQRRVREALDGTPAS